MKKSRFTEEQIAYALRLADATKDHSCGCDCSVALPSQIARRHPCSKVEPFNIQTVSAACVARTESTQSAQDGFQKEDPASQ